MKGAVVDLLARHLSGHCSRAEIARMIEVPPAEELGDFACPCFHLARVMKKSPASIAEELAKKVAGAPFLAGVTAAGGYLNFFLDARAMADGMIADASDGAFGRPALPQGRRVVVEYSSPNSNKPLHLGHLRNMAIGEATCRILSFCGDQVVRTSINNDRGVHICKSMLAYAECGDGMTPEKAGRKSDHFVGDYYVLFGQKAAVDASWNMRAQELLRKWEAHDGKTVALWRKMNKWAFDGFAETYRLFGVTFDKEYFESDIYHSGKEIVADGVKRGVFTARPDGAVVADLEKESLGEKVLLRPDGTSVYIVQDLYLAVLKEMEYHYGLSLYVVGNEQEHHFAVLKALFRRLGNPIGDRLAHLSYGMVELPEGKMKSREGTVVDADDLIRETQELAKTELRGRYSLSEKEMEERSLKIALAAIKYQLLKVDTAKNMVFDPKKAISFEGDTGPYLLYSYARASSILRKAGDVPPGKAGELEKSEVRLLKKIAAFPDTVQAAYGRLSATILAVYAFELAQVFNEFYHSCPVIGSDSAPFRLALVGVFRAVLKRCLWLLGMEEIEEM
jgi:arginyl-tRNA synthetase